MRKIKLVVLLLFLFGTYNNIAAQEIYLIDPMHDINPGVEVYQPNDVIILEAALSPDGRRAALASSDGKIKIWDTVTGRK